MSVDLRRTHIGVSEQLLNRSEICSAFEEMGRVRMPQRVGMQGPPVGSGWRARTRRTSRGVMRRPRAFTNSAVVSVGAASAGRAFRRYAATASQRGVAEREPADLRALAEHGDRAPCAGRRRVEVEAAALAHAEAGAVRAARAARRSRDARGSSASVRVVDRMLEHRRPHRRVAARAAAASVRAASARRAATSRCEHAPAAQDSARTRAPTRPCARSTPSRSRASGGTRGSAAACGGRDPTRVGSRPARTTRRTRRRRARRRVACARSRP